MMDKLFDGIRAYTRPSDLALALVGLFLFSSLVHRFSSKGPMLWPVLGIIPTIFFHKNHIYEWATLSLIRCGGTFPYKGMWMGGAHGVITVDPATIEHMLKTRFKNYPKGKYYRDRFRDLLGDGIFNADDDVWKEQRRAASSELHSARFADYSARSMQNLVHRKLLRLLRRLAGSGRSIDLQDVLLRFTFDNICTAAFGVDPGCLALDLPEVPFAKAFEQATELTLFRFMVPPFVWKPMRFFSVGSEKQLKEAVRTVHEFAEKTVVDRRIEWRKCGGLDRRCDLLSRLIEAQGCRDEHGTSHRFSDKFLKDFCISFILAGRDTSSVALAWFFWLIHKHPQVETKIVEEIVGILEQRDEKKSCNYEDDDDDAVVLRVDELKKMDYLQAALSEALRLYPSVPFDFKEVVEDDVFPDGTAVKKGARVIYSIFSMARMESIWGKDCREFKPERWMREGQFLSENQFKYVVFNAGPRLCVGKKFAYMQMKMVAASVLLRYSVHVVEGHVVVPKLTTTLYMQNGLQVVFKPRNYN
ncbi:hypothetical protein ACLOJK_012159 [Asimina triloba]